MKLYKTRRGAIIEHEGASYLLPGADWDHLINRDGLAGWLAQAIRGAERLPDGFDPAKAELQAPVGTQEIWAAGVTYLRSRDARMDEAASAGGASFYDKVYVSERPELFFKATPHRVAGPRQDVRIRKDANWNVPEPELTVVASSRGRILGYTIGNDMSSRDIEGENPLYLPQAKVYMRSCALGPCILATEQVLGPDTAIEMEIHRAGQQAFRGQTKLAQMKRTPGELVEWLFRDNEFPSGCFLLTGTGIVPPDQFTLASGDEIRIRIDGIGELTNRVA